MWKKICARGQLCKHVQSHQDLDESSEPHVLSLNYRSQPSFRTLARSSHSQRLVSKVAMKIKALSPSLEFIPYLRV